MSKQTTPKSLYILSHLALTDISNCQYIIFKRKVIYISHVNVRLRDQPKLYGKVSFVLPKKNWHRRKIGILVYYVGY